MSFPPPDPPSVSVSSTKVTVNQTFPASFSCEAFGIPPPTLQWFSSLSNTSIQHQEGVLTITMGSHVNGSGLEIRTSKLSFNFTSRDSNEANYTCRAQNGIQNFIGTPQQATVELIVQGNA